MEFSRLLMVYSRQQPEGQLVTEAVPTLWFLLPPTHTPLPSPTQGFSTPSSSVAHGQPMVIHLVSVSKKACNSVDQTFYLERYFQPL